MKKLLLFAFGLSACGGELCTEDSKVGISVRADRACPRPKEVVIGDDGSQELHDLIETGPGVEARSVCWYRVEKSEEVDRACTYLDRVHLLQRAMSVQTNNWTLSSP